MSIQKLLPFRWFIIVLCVSTPITVVAQSTPSAGDLFLYSAEYQAEYKGKHVGNSVFGVSHSGDDYIYRSSTQIKGLLRLASPKPIVDQSVFRVESGHIMPSAFTHEDGSRKGEDNHSIVFDWQNNIATISFDGGTREFELTRGVLDRGSIQVALMFAAAQGIETFEYSVLDEDSIKTYSYEFDGEHQIDTEIGELSVLRYLQSRENSSRRTVIDLAPAHHYVPVRIEQFRDNESQSAFHIESITPSAE